MGSLFSTSKPTKSLNRVPGITGEQPAMPPGPRCIESSSVCTPNMNATPTTTHTRHPPDSTASTLSSVILPPIVSFTSATNNTSRLGATLSTSASHALSSVSFATSQTSQPTTAPAVSLTSSALRAGSKGAASLTLASSPIGTASSLLPLTATATRSTTTQTTDISGQATVMPSTHPSQLTKKGVSESAIAGGIVAAVLALCIIAAVLLYMRRRARKERDGWKRESYEPSLRETPVPDWEYSNHQIEADPERVKVGEHHLSGHTFTDAASDLEYAEPNYGYPSEKIGYAL